MYRAIIEFGDLQDNGYTYKAGDPFPRTGLRVSAARLAELAGNDNRMGFPLIRAEAEPKAAPDDAPKPAPKKRRAPAKKKE